MKKIAFFILVALLPVLASAYDAEIDGIYYNLSGDEAEVTYRDYSYNSYSGAVVIPQSVSYNGQTYRVTSIGFYAFEGCSDLTSITFPEGLTSIDSWAFKGCTGLTTVSLPRTLTDIGNGAFDDCTNLVSVSYDPDGVPHIGQWVLDDTAWYKNQPEGLVYLGKSVYKFKQNGYASVDVAIEEGTRSIAGGAFHYCYYVKSLIIPNSVKYIGSSAFFQIGVSSITLPEGITEICDETFDACASLTSITIPNNVKRIGQHAFYNCSKLESITFPDGLLDVGKQAFANTPWYNNQPDGVVYAGSVAYLYKGTMPDGTSIDLKEGTKGISAEAFCYYDEMTSITIPSSVSSIGAGAFKYCSGLTSISLPEGLTQIEEETFRGCTGLTSATIPNGVTLIDKNAFYGCSGLTSIIIPNGVTRLNSSAFYNCTGLTSVTIPGSVSVILDKVFMNCKSLTAINLPEGVRSIGSEAFRDCNSLTSITIPSTVTDRGSNIFSGCYVAESAFVNNSNYPDNSWGVNFIDQEINGLLIKDNIVLKCRDWVTSANIPEGITGIGRHAFDNCPNLTSVTFPASVKTIDSSAFYECKGLTSVTFQEGLTSIGDNAFQFCKGLTSITIPGSVTTIGKYAFANCSGLTSVTLLEGSTVIDKYAFQNCSSLTSVNLQEGLTVIGNYAFQDCSSLTSITIPNSVTSIGEYAFRDCKGLTSITIPNSVTTIGTEAFNGCTSLTTVTIGNGVTKIGNGAFYGCNKIATLSIDMESVGTTFANSTMLSTLTLGNNVRTIKGEAFKGCSMLTTVNIGDGVRSINNTSFQGINNNAKFYVKDKTLSLLALWNAGYDSNIYDADTQAKIEPFKPVFDVTASSLKFVEGLTGIRRITKLSEKLYLNDAEGTAFTGLDPDTEVNVKYSVILKYLNEDETFTFERTSSVKTAELVLTTKQPKVISDGNVIVAAQSNLDDEETNVGFEWRRTDWTDDFDSKTGGAYLYEGAMEGYIRSLNSKYLWKFRPYYTSNAGNTYYGDWKGLDPSDYSYFEPTVHTYANINVQGNTAEVRGYAMRGTDNIVTQGFIYWQNRSSYSLRKKAASIPSDAITVTTAKTNIMTATLEDLEFETEYCCVAFVTTSEDETFYGEPQTFSTSVDPVGIKAIEKGQLTIDNEGDWFTLDGKKLDKPQRGINIIRYSDGSTRKVLIK